MIPHLERTLSRGKYKSGEALSETGADVMCKPIIGESLHPYLPPYVRYVIAISSMEVTNVDFVTHLREAEPETRN